MSNLSTIGGAVLCTAVASALMLAALAPVSLPTPNGGAPAGTDESAWKLRRGNA